MRIVRNKRGQFILIAALLIALMIISVSAIMYSSVTYFKHEQWEDYLIVIDSVKASTNNLLGISLANYTQNPSDAGALNYTLFRWREDLKKAYAGYGAIFDYSLVSGPYSVYGMNLNYNLGLASSWNQRISFSAANASGSLNITSVGLTGYKFTSSMFLKMNITDAIWYPTDKSNPAQVGVRVVISAEGPTVVGGLEKSNFVQFQIGGINQDFSVRHYFETLGHPAGSVPLNTFVYELRYPAASKPATVAVTISLVDSRNIKVTGQATLTTLDA